MAHSRMPLTLGELSARRSRQSSTTLLAESSPRISLDLPENTVDSIGMATLRLLEIIRDIPQSPRFLYASSSEVFRLPTPFPTRRAYAD